MFRLRSVLGQIFILVSVSDKEYLRPVVTKLFETESYFKGIEYYEGLPV